MLLNTQANLHIYCVLKHSVIPPLVKRRGSQVSLATNVFIIAFTLHTELPRFQDTMLSCDRLSFVRQRYWSTYIEL